MIISLIAAMDEARAIGRDNRLCWHLPKDMEHFRQLTLGHPVIMGRKTYESIGHPLPGRTNIVITRQAGLCADGCVVVHDLEEAYAACGKADEIFVAGGAELYRAALPGADRIYLTLVHARINGDAFFPDIPPEFKLQSSQSVNDAYPIDFLVYTRKSDKF